MIRTAFRFRTSQASPWRAYLSTAEDGYIVRSQYPDVKIPACPLFEYVLGEARNTGNSSNSAIVNGRTGESITYDEMQVGVRNIASNLQSKAGIKKGDVVAMFSPNDVRYPLAFHGIIMAGGIATTANPTYTAQEFAGQISDSGAKIVFTHAAMKEQALEAIELSSGVVEELYVFGDSFDSALMATAPSPAAVSFNAHEDVAILPYSSGTTGKPKGTELTHTNLVANLAQIMVPDGQFLSRDDVVYCPLPFFHIYGMIAGMNLPLLRGSTVLTTPSFDFAEMLQLVPQKRVTRIHAVPPIILGLAKHPAVDQSDFSSVKMILSAAAPLGSQVAEVAATRLGTKIKQGWGMTELSPAGTLTSDDDPRFEHCNALVDVGGLVPNCTAKIVDVSLEPGESGFGDPLPPGSEGELWIKGPNVMKGYLGQPEANAVTLVDGWLRTGDICAFDANGKLEIRDRSKELIKYKGFQVAPAELEALLLTNESVGDCCVVGKDDEEAGELPVAFIVLRPEAQETTEEDICNWVAERVAGHKKLRGGVILVDSVPKSASGKLLRRELRDRLKAK